MCGLMVLIEIKRNSSKGVSFYDFIVTFAMCVKDLFDFICGTKISESSDMARFGMIHCYICT